MQNLNDQQKKFLIERFQDLIYKYKSDIIGMDDKIDYAQRSFESELEIGIEQIKEDVINDEDIEDDQMEKEIIERVKIFEEILFSNFEDRLLEIQAEFESKVKEKSKEN